MLQLDEYDQLLVANPFADDSVIASSIDKHAALTLDSDPLRTQSVSPPSVPSVTIVDSEVEIGPRSALLVNLDGSSAEEDPTTTSVAGASHGGNKSITHSVGPTDSFAGVALRYGVSIAALRRANQLWPSDPIHLRTELLIPRGDTHPIKLKHVRRVASMDIALHSTHKQAPSRSPDLVASSLVTARNMIFSILPARLSLETLSSKTSASEEHELDDLQAARAHKVTTIQAPFAEQGLELSIISSPRAQHKRPAALLPSQVPYSPTMKHRDLNHTSPAGSLHLRSSSSSPTVFPERPARSHPFTVRPVRTSQLEPEPAMELPARRPRS
ncbi:hypothetical protein JVU11DRAFT_10701 [Chiua virens]|nr:hypothetical protein JVU11DRAFT_10701 [Chiua virens]